MKKKTPAEELIIQEAQRWDGIDFSNFVDIALYHPRYGYYNQGVGQRGRSGDYFTSVQVSAFFPQIVGKALRDLKEELGCDYFSLIELGSGGGEFLEGLLTYLKQHDDMRKLRVWVVERSRPAREKLKRLLTRFGHCTVVDSIDDIEGYGTLEGCVFSNEFFDALPFHRLKYSKTGWKEIMVAVQAGELSEVERPLSHPEWVQQFKLDQLSFEDGQEIELRSHLDQWMSKISSVLIRGYVMTFDYGYARAQLMDPTRMKGTWLCYSEHTTNDQAFRKVGKQDITAHVDFTALSEEGEKVGLTPLLFSSQGIFLTQVGQSIFENALASATPANQQKITAAVQQLIHPQAMGEKFWMFLQGKEMGLPAPFKDISNRLRRLKS